MSTDFEAALDLIAETREHLEAAIETLQMLGREVPEMRTRIEVYLISTLEQAISDDNEWLGGSNSANLATLEAELTAETHPQVGDELLIRFNNELVGVTVIGVDDVSIITECPGERTQITIPHERAASVIVENRSR